MNDLRTTAIIGICALALLGCGRQANQHSEPSGQVLVHIGNEVVTSLELDNELRLANVPPERRRDPAILKPMLTELVLRKYLVQQALAAKLDQEPNVLLDLRRGREMALANAIMIRKAANASPSRADIDAFIAANPDKFAYRIVLTLDQIRFSIGPNIQNVIAANKAADSLEKIDMTLTSMGIPHNRLVGDLSQGDLPQDLVKALQARKSDETFFGRLGASGIYFKVKSQAMRPLDGEAAANFARLSLRVDADKADIAAASAAAQREAVYSGEFAGLMAATPAAVAAPIEATPSPKN